MKRSFRIRCVQDCNVVPARVAVSFSAVAAFLVDFKAEDGREKAFVRNVCVVTMLIFRNVVSLEDLNTATFFCQSISQRAKQ